VWRIEISVQKVVEHQSNEEEWWWWWWWWWRRFKATRDEEYIAI